jgi:ABC-type multidrug transport system fused ATPase/permease subunit
MIAVRVAAVRRMMTLLGITSRQVVLMVTLGVITAAFEAVGIGLLIPLLGYVEQGARVFEDNGLASAVARIVAPFGIAPSLPLLFVAAFVPVIGRQCFRFLRDLHATRIRFAAIARLRCDGMAALLDADLGFVLAGGHARLASTLTTEVERCSDALTLFLMLVESVLLASVYLVMLFVVAAPLVPVVMVGMLLTALTVRAGIRNTERWGQRVTAQGQALHAAIAERLIGFRMVKLRGREVEESARVAQLATDLASSRTTIYKVQCGLEAAVEPVMLVGVLGALYVAIGVLNVGLARIGAFGLIVTRLVPLLRQGNLARLGIAALIGGLQEIANQVQAARASAGVAVGGVAFPGLQHDIVFDRVGFRYDGRQEDEGQWAVRDVSFRVTRGSLTAIVGRSGAGKSTLLDLVPRLRTVTRGDIRIDGVPIERFDLRTLRRGIGFVDQEGFLFDGTIADNIAYGVPGATREAIAAAARRAHAAEFIERLPEAYETRTGPQGNRLSVGERQRLCIARVILQDPDILLLDEPTSALDGESEQYIRAVLDEVGTCKAVIVVAHRLSTIRGANQIIVMDRGRVVEYGDHDRLVAQLGPYHQLFDLQTAG